MFLGPSLASMTHFCVRSGSALPFLFGNLSLGLFYHFHLSNDNMGLFDRSSINEHAGQCHCAHAFTVADFHDAYDAFSFRHFIRGRCKYLIGEKDLAWMYCPFPSYPKTADRCASATKHSTSEYSRTGHQSAEFRSCERTPSCVHHRIMP